MAWLSVTELDKVVVHVVRLASFLWLWFQSVCPLMSSLSAYRLTWVSLTLDVGYLFMVAPAKHSHCSLPWMWGCSSHPRRPPYICTKSLSPVWLFCDPMDYSPARLLYPRGFPGKNTGMGCHLLLQGIFPTQESKLHLLDCMWFLYHWT